MRIVVFNSGIACPLACAMTTLESLFDNDPEEQAQVQLEEQAESELPIELPSHLPLVPRALTAKKIRKEARTLIDELVDYFLPIPPPPKRNLHQFFADLCTETPHSKPSLVTSLLQKRGIKVPKLSPSEGPLTDGQVTEGQLTILPPKQSKFYASHARPAAFQALNERLTQKQREISLKKKIQASRKTGPELTVKNGRIIEEEEILEALELKDPILASSESEAEFSQSSSSESPSDASEASSSSEDEEEIGAKLLDLISQKFDTSTLPQTPKISSAFVDGEAEVEDEQGNLILEQEEPEDLALLCLQEQEMRASKFIREKNSVPDAAKVASLFVQQEIERERKDVEVIYENVKKRSMEMDNLYGRYAIDSNDIEDMQHISVPEQESMIEAVLLDSGAPMSCATVARDMPISGNQIEMKFERKVTLGAKDKCDATGVRRKKFQLPTGQGAERVEEISAASSTAPKKSKTFQIVNHRAEPK